MKKLLIVMLLLLTACSHSGAPSQEDIEDKGRKFQELARSKSFAMTENPYVGVRAVPIKEDDRSNGALNSHVVLRQRGTLAGIVASIADLTPLSVQIGADPAPLTKTPKEANEPQPPVPSAGTLPDILAVPGSGPSTMLNISYEGPLKGLLEQVSIASGYGWDFDSHTKTIVFSRLMSRTFTILGAPGKREFKDNITNKSKDTQRSSIGGNGINSTVQTSDTTSQTQQTNSTDYSFNIFEDCVNVIKTMLSPEGSVVANQAAGTITVRDHAANVRQVGGYIADTNTRLSRQVALTVNVWALEVNDANEAGLEVQALFENKDVVIAAGGALSGVGGLGSATATILTGKLKNTSGVLKALKEFGNARQVTSGGGLVLSNQPLPIQAIKRIAYIAGTSTTNNQTNSSTEITPGEVTTGFSMTLIPHILDRRRVILQYTVNLSSLDELTEFTANEVTIQLPKTSSRAFSQRSSLMMGQTLVLAGFQDQAQQIANALGIFKLGRSADYKKTILVITIEVEAAGGGSED